MHRTRHISALILAAGRSRRMGAFKPLLPLRGGTVIECTVESALQGGAEWAVVVTGNRAEDVEAVLNARFSDRVRTVRNEEWAHTDMLRSVQIGAAALGDCNAFFLLPGDMPFVDPATFAALLEQRQKSPAPVLFPVANGQRGHPPLIDAALIPAILNYHGEDGLRGLWRQYEADIRTIPVEDSGIFTDLDTPEDYERRTAPGGNLPAGLSRKHGKS